MKKIGLYLLLLQLHVLPGFAQEAGTGTKNSRLPQPVLFAEDTISTGEYETHPALSPSGDTLYFLKCAADLNVCAICVSYHRNGRWSAPEILPFSGQYLDADPFVTKDGHTLYFVSNRPLQNGDSIRPDWDIWKVSRTTGGWGQPVHLDTPVNSNASEYYPTLADNGTLYFGSSRAGGKGGADIYRSRLTNSGYRVVENLGGPINTADNEYEPFIAPDETYLIWMATIPQGLQHADFYISRQQHNSWSQPVQLPAPVNSGATDWSPKVSRDGRYFYFGSTRSKTNGALPQRENIKQWNKRMQQAGNGLGDIYRVDFSALQQQ
jgi:Tol biopolymer transport system component